MSFLVFHTSPQHSPEQTSAAMHVRALSPVLHLQIQSVFTSEYKQTFWDGLAFRVKVKLEMSQQLTYHDLHLCKGKLLTYTVPGTEADHPEIFDTMNQCHMGVLVTSIKHLTHVLASVGCLT